MVKSDGIRLAGGLYARPALLVHLQGDVCSCGGAECPSSHQHAGVATSSTMSCFEIVDVQICFAFSIARSHLGVSRNKPNGAGDRGGRRCRAGTPHHELS